MYAGSKTSKTKIEEKENMTLEALAQDIRADHARNDLCFIEPYHTDADVVENSCFCQKCGYRLDRREIDMLLDSATDSKHFHGLLDEALLRDHDCPD